MTILDLSAELDMPRGTLTPDEAELAAVAFLARYSGRTLDAYRHDLRNLFHWAADHGLAVLLGLNGLRVSEACETNIEDMAFERGHRVLRIIGKGNKPALIPLVPRTARTIDLAVGERRQGPHRNASWEARISVSDAAICRCPRRHLL